MGMEVFTRNGTPLKCPISCAYGAPLMKILESFRGFRSHQGFPFTFHF